MPSGCVRRVKSALGEALCWVGCEQHLAQLVLDFRTTVLASALPSGGCNSQCLRGLLLG